MARFNKRPSGLIVPAAPIVSTPSSAARTVNNAPGFVRDVKSELFLLGVANFVGMDSHAEKAFARDSRFKNLVRQAAREDPSWCSRFLIWLRTEANMRTASLVGACEMVKGCLDAGMLSLKSGPNETGYLRRTVDQVCQRSDEPGEILGYWMSQYGRKLPKPLKRGVGDAAKRLYTEWSTLKYDTDSHAFRYADVIELAQLGPGAMSEELHTHILDRRFKHREPDFSELPLFCRNHELRSKVAEGSLDLLLNSRILGMAGMTWEDSLSLAEGRLPKKQVWEAIIPAMNVVALLSNLRNFDQAGVSDEAAQRVISKLTSQQDITRSRVLPMQILSAFNAVSNLRWAYPLEQAIQLSLNNIPEFGGNTLILIDTSGSMDETFSKDGTLKRWDAAALFGLALAQRCERTTVVSFSNHSREFPLTKGASLLTMLKQFKGGYFFNGGTNTMGTIQLHWNNSFDRLVVLTDEQANSHYGSDVFYPIPANKMAITFNLAGYRVGHAPSGTPFRVTIGGLNDKAFKLMPMLERRTVGWPF